jgi:very-short-patch-repair endonuclease
LCSDPTQVVHTRTGVTHEDPTPDHRLAAVASTQRGLLTTAQARAAGLTAAQIAHRARRGTLERLGGGVLAVAGHELTWERRALAAFLAAGRGAAVSHRTAARLLGFDGFGEGPIDVTVPRGRRPVLPAGARLHTMIGFDRFDCVRVEPFTVTSGAVTIIHLAAMCGTKQLSSAIGSATRDGWTSEAFLRRRFAALRGPGRHGAAVLATVLDEPVGHSELERRFLRLIAKAGLPRPTTQRTFRQERTIRVDALWEPQRLIVEVVGHRFHCTALDLRRDAYRRNELQSLGFDVLEFTAYDIDREPDRVIAILRRRLAQSAT